MAKVKGINCILYDGSTQIYTENWTIDEGMQLIETSEQGDTGEEWTATFTNGNVSFDGFWDPNNAEHVALITKLRAGTPITFTGTYVGTKGSGTAVGVQGTVIMEKFSRKTGKKDMVGFSASGKISGTPTDATNL
jgi:hypothetical protein